MDRSDVAIIGAGPYGLAAAAHLRQIAGLDIRLFGEPMSFWERHMPRGMRLRSPWLGSHIADPDKRFTLDAYRDAVGPAGLAYPVPATDFVKYGRWFQEQAAVPAHRSTVTRIESGPSGFQLSTEEGRTFLARRVIVAGGIQPFAYRPEIFQGLPSSLVSHTSERIDVDQFSGKNVMVVGAGQSALEAAGFLAAAGAGAGADPQCVGALAWPPPVAAWQGARLAALRKRRHRTRRREPDRPAAQSVSPAATTSSGVVGPAIRPSRRVGHDRLPGAEPHDSR